MQRKKFVFVERRNKFLGENKKFVCEERLNSHLKKEDFKS